MVKEALVEFPLEAGRLLLQRMDEAGLEIIVAYWTYLEEEEEWRLVLASPLVETKGPRFLLNKIQELQAQMTERERDDLTVRDIGVVGPHRSTLEEMRRRRGVVTHEPEQYGRRERNDRSQPYIYRLV